MANFTGERVQIDDTVTNYNLGYDKSGQIKGEAMGRAFASLGDAISTAAKGYKDYQAKQDELREDALYNQISNEFDSLNDKYIGQFGNSTNPNPDPADQSIARAGQEIGRLQNAYNQNRMTDTNYKMHLYNYSRQLRAQNPDKAKEIDEMIRSVTGIRPANAVKSALDAEAQAQQTDAAKQRKDAVDYIQANTDLGMAAFADVIQDPFGASEKRIQQALSYIAQKQQLNADRKQLEADFDFETKLTNAQKKDWTERVQNQIVYQSQEVISMVMADAGLNTTQEIQAALADPNKVAELSGMLNMAKVEGEREVRKYLNGLGMTQAEIEVAVTNANKTTESYIAALTGGADITPLAQDALATKLLTDKHKRSVWAQYGHTLTVFNEFGQEQTRLAMTNTEDGRRQWAQLGMGLATLTAQDQMGGGYGGARQLGEPEAVKQGLQFSAQMLADPEYYKKNPQGYKNLAMSFLDSRAASGTFDGKSNEEVYKLFTRPDVVEGIYATGDPEVIDRLYEFAFESFQTMGDLRELGGNLGEAMGETKEFFAFNIGPDGKVQAGIDEEKWNAWKEDKSYGTIARYLRNFETLKHDLDRINPLLQGLGTVVARNNQGDPSQVPEIAQQALAFTGMDPNSKGTINLVMDYMVGTVGEDILAAGAAISGVTLVDYATVLSREKEILKGFRGPDRLPRQGSTSLDRTTTGSVGGAQGTEKQDGFTIKDQPVQGKVNVTDGVDMNDPVVRQVTGWQESISQAQGQPSSAGPSAPKPVVYSDVGAARSGVVSTFATPDTAVSISQPRALPKDMKPADVEQAIAPMAKTQLPNSADARTIASSSTNIELAQNLIGMDEKNPEHAQILSSFIKENSGIEINPANTAWCAAFVGGVIGANGGEGTGKLNARSYLEWGEAVAEPKEGDVVVFSRGDPNGWQGHVGFFKGYDDKGNILVLGGNQGNKVSIQAYPRERFLGARRAPAQSEMQERPQVAEQQMPGDLGRIGGGSLGDGIEKGKQVTSFLSSTIGDGAAKAVTANIMGETMDFRALEEMNPTVKGSRGGIGLIQWTGPRREQFEKWATTNGKDVSDISHNLEYLLEEAQGKHGNHWSKGYSWEEFQRVANADPEQGTIYFMKGFLRPGIPHLEGRLERLGMLA